MKTANHLDAAPAAPQTPAASTATQRAAAEIRGLMGARQLGAGELSDVLGLSTSSAVRRYKGLIDLTLNEVEAIAAWLDVPVTRIIAPAAGAGFRH